MKGDFKRFSFTEQEKGGETARTTKTFATGCRSHNSIIIIAAPPQWELLSFVGAAFSREGAANYHRKLRDRMSLPQQQDHHCRPAPVEMALPLWERLSAAKGSSIDHQRLHHHEDHEAHGETLTIDFLRDLRALRGETLFSRPLHHLPQHIIENPAVAEILDFIGGIEPTGHHNVAG